MAQNPLISLQVATADPAGAFQKGFAGTQKLVSGQETIKQQRTKTISDEQKGQLQTAVLKGIELEKILTQPDTQKAQADGIGLLVDEIGQRESRGLPTDGLKVIMNKIQSGDVAGGIADIQKDREQAKQFGIGAEGLKASTVAAGGGATGALIDKLIDSAKSRGEKLSPMQALGAIKGMAGAGLGFDEQGNVVALSGVAKAKGSIKEAEAFGTKSGELISRRDLEPEVVKRIETAKQEVKISAEKPLERLALRGMKDQNGLVSRKIARAREIMAQQSDLGRFSLQAMPTTEARELREIFQTIRANVGFDKLQAMREASKTGGALGQVSDKENELLQAVAGSLDLGQPFAAISGNLDEIESARANSLNNLSAKFSEIHGEDFDIGDEQPADKQEGFTEDKKSRLEELRAKRDAGTLQ